MNKTKKICIDALLIALICVATMVIKIPVVATSGYIHLGDSIILLVGLFFGCETAVITCGIGSALADYLLGYPHWILFTLIIKTLMGLLMAKISSYSKSERKEFFSFRNIAACVVTEAWMVLGYLIFGTYLKSNFTLEAATFIDELKAGFFTAITSVPSNIVQGVGGIILFLIIGYALHKAKIYKYIS